LAVWSLRRYVVDLDRVRRDHRRIEQADERLRDERLHLGVVPGNLDARARGNDFAVVKSWPRSTVIVSFTMMPVFVNLTISTRVTSSIVRYT
jgi:hypothetical protein